MTRTTRVFLVDDHAMILPGIRMVVESRDGFEVVGEATDGLTAYNRIVDLEPDIAVIDLSVPVLNGFEIARRLREKKSAMKVLFLTPYSDDSCIREVNRSALRQSRPKQSDCLSVFVRKKMMK